MGLYLQMTPQDTFLCAAPLIVWIRVKVKFVWQNVVPAPTKDVDSGKVTVTLKDKELDFICAPSWRKIGECFHIESAQFDL